MMIEPTRMTVADYSQALKRGEITVNRDYQRSDKVWPDTARSFLIETILLDFPVPKLSLHQLTDVRSRLTVKQVVDGQQRTTAVTDFYNDQLRLTRTLDLKEAAGRTYSELDEDLQYEFLDYGLDFDLFVGASYDDVREVFRRMNSFTVPLNPEEHRHAVNQGPFKWFIHRLSRKYDRIFAEAGAFGAKQLVRMADAKLLTEICHAYFHGITTTRKTALDRLYREKDRAFPEQDDLSERLEGSLNQVFTLEAVRGTALMKPYSLYPLVLAVMHVKDPLESLASAFPPREPLPFESQAVRVNLSRLADALENPDAAGDYKPFADASAEKTNVERQRLTRFMWCCRALTDESM